MISMLQQLLSIQVLFQVIFITLTGKRDVVFLLELLTISPLHLDLMYPMDQVAELPAIMHTSMLIKIKKSGGYNPFTDVGGGVRRGTPACMIALYDSTFQTNLRKAIKDAYPGTSDESINSGGFTYKTIRTFNTDAERLMAASASAGFYYVEETNII